MGLLYKSDHRQTELVPLSQRSVHFPFPYFHLFLRHWPEVWACSPWHSAFSISRALLPFYLPLQKLWLSLFLVFIWAAAKMFSWLALVFLSVSNTTAHLFFFFFFWDRVSLCSPGWPGAHFLNLAGLELRNLPASASWVLGLKVCAITPSLSLISFIN
jgi:hypothetical protein